MSRITLPVSLVVAWVMLVSGCGLIVAGRSGPMAGFDIADVVKKSGSSAGLPTVRLQLGRAELRAEVAHTPLQKASGLAFRTSLDPNGAMLFTNAVPQRVVYYTKDTLIPLSCAYLDADGIILEIHDMHPRDVRRVVSRSDRVRFVLEVNRGWFEAHGVIPGDRVRYVR